MISSVFTDRWISTVTPRVALFGSPNRRGIQRIGVYTRRKIDLAGWVRATAFCAPRKKTLKQVLKLVAHEERL